MTSLIKVKKEDLERKITEAIIKAEGFEWSGWYIPIYIDLDDGNVTDGSWLSGQSHTPGYSMVAKVMAWNVEEMEERKMNKKEKKHAINWHAENDILNFYFFEIEEYNEMHREFEIID